MTLTAAGHVDAVDPYFLRMDTNAVPTVPTGPSECGFVAYARTLAEGLCVTMHGSTWQAASRTRAMPHPRIDNRSDVTVLIDGRHLVTVQQHTPAGTDRDMWTIRLNCRPIVHRLFRGEIPHQVPMITRSVWRHLNRVHLDTCDTIGCHAPATVATWGAHSMCQRCAARYAQTGR
ncbi:hypothetical protein AB0M46_13525 [Dactylosporangium sp. NPDC051485]|uniref:hypothetical protein n=1 Tax=Dactylosporangium sp. NPDC051485 TaxID=3154846 RepID=UPI003412CB40